MTHKRILVALSLADGRDPAFERALALAQTSGAELYLLHAVPAVHPFSSGATQRLQRAAKLRARAAAAGVTAQTIEQHGDPAEIILLHADARAVDLVVMGTERRTGWARLRERSVAERVLRRTTRPTLVVAADDTGEGAVVRKVLVAVDLSPASATVVDTARQLLGSEARQVTVLHAVDSIEAATAVHSYARWMVPEYRSYMLGDARRRLESLLPPSVATDVTLQARATAGPPAEVIAAHAADLDADVIVLGRSKRFLHLGSTALRLLRTTNRALLVVPPAAIVQTIAAPSVHPRAA